MVKSGRRNSVREMVWQGAKHSKPDAACEQTTQPTDNSTPSAQTPHTQPTDKSTQSARTQHNKNNTHIKQSIFQHKRLTIHKLLKGSSKKNCIF